MEAVAALVLGSVIMLGVLLHGFLIIATMDAE